MRLFVRPKSFSRWISPSGKSLRRSPAERRFASSQSPFLRHPSVNRLFSARCSRSGKNWKKGNW